MLWLGIQEKKQTRKNGSFSFPKKHGSRLLRRLLGFEGTHTLPDRQRHTDTLPLPHFTQLDSGGGSRQFQTESNIITPEWRDHIKSHRSPSNKVNRVLHAYVHLFISWCENFFSQISRTPTKKKKEIIYHQRSK